MTTEAPIFMPGSFTPDHELLHRLQEGAASKVSPSLFLPPSISPCFTPNATTSSRNLPASERTRRKRPRLERSDDFVNISKLETYGGQTTRNSSFTLDTASPAPLANTQYHLAGGLDSFAEAETAQDEQRQTFDFEQDCRLSRYTQQIRSTKPDHLPYTPILTEHCRQKLGQPSGWGQTVWNLTGSVAGKVFNFCWNTAFRGFHAGAGPGYNLDIGTPYVASTGATQLQQNDDVFHKEYRGRSMTPVPGEFPRDDLIEDYMSQTRRSVNMMTPTQRENESEGDASIKQSWVIVNEPYSDSQESSPVRKRSRLSTASFASSRPVPRGMSLGSRPSMPSRHSTHSNASYASPRAVSGRSNLRSKPLANHTDDPLDNTTKRSRPSYASPRHSTTHTPTHVNTSPEVQSFEKKLRRKEARQDASIHRLNQQMQDMIREAQQALGSKVEVGDLVLEDVDEGYAER